MTKPRTTRGQSMSFGCPETMSFVSPFIHILNISFVERRFKNVRIIFHSNRCTILLENTDFDTLLD